VRVALIAVLLPVALAAQEDLQPVNGRIRDSLVEAPSLRELHDGRLLLSNWRGGLQIADFATGRVKDLPGVSTGGRSTRLFALGGDSTLALWSGGSIVLDGTRVVSVTPIKRREPGVAPRIAGADRRGFRLMVAGVRPVDSATALRIDPATGAEELVARLWLRPFVDLPHLDMQESALLAPDGWIAVFRVEPYRVDWRSPSGEWLRGAPLVLPVLAMDDREKRVFSDAALGFVPPGTEKDESAAWSGTVELFSGNNLMIPTPDSGVLIRRRSIADARGSLYDIVDRRGKLVRELEISGKDRIIGFGAASVYVFTTHGGSAGGHLERHPWS
jgi:hypothetical protein